jgi:hypothetical protein
MAQRHRATALPTLLVVVVLGSGCADDGSSVLTGGSARPGPSAVAASSDPQPAPTQAAPTHAAPTPSSVPAPPAAVPSAAASSSTATTSTAGPAGGPLTVIAVRVARQEGFDRVVLELAGQVDGVPGWQIAYEQDPRRDGSGDPVDVAGAAVLVVRVLGAGYPFDTGQVEASAVSVPRGTEVVQDVVLGSVFEGTYEAFVGVRTAAPFRVTRLTGPTRVVVDIDHP